MARGIKGITVEIGNPQLFQNQYVQWSYLGVMRILSYLNMFSLDAEPSACESENVDWNAGPTSVPGIGNTESNEPLNIEKQQQQSIKSNSCEQCFNSHL